MTPSSLVSIGKMAAKNDEHLSQCFSVHLGPEKQKNGRSPKKYLGEVPETATPTFKPGNVVSRLLEVAQS